MEVTCAISQKTEIDLRNAASNGNLKTVQYVAYRRVAYAGHLFELCESNNNIVL